MAVEGQVEGGEAGVINEWLLATYILFVTFLTQFGCDLLKGKTEYHRTKNQLPRVVHVTALVWLHYSDFITYLLIEF